MSFYAGGEVLRGADVETAVSARKNVDVIHLNAAPRLVPLITRSGHHSTLVNVIDAFVARHERAPCASRMVEPIGIEPTTS